MSDIKNISLNACKCVLGAVVDLLEGDPLERCAHRILLPLDDLHRVKHRNVLLLAEARVLQQGLTEGWGLRVRGLAILGATLTLLLYSRSAAHPTPDGVDAALCSFTVPTNRQYRRSPHNRVRLSRSVVSIRDPIDANNMETSAWRLRVSIYEELRSPALSIGV